MTLLFPINVVSMLTRLRFKRFQNRARGCNQVRIIPRPLRRPADGGTVHIQSTGHLASVVSLADNTGITQVSFYEKFNHILIEAVSVN